MPEPLVAVIEGQDKHPAQPWLLWEQAHGAMPCHVLPLREALGTAWSYDAHISTAVVHSTAPAIEFESAPGPLAMQPRLRKTAYVDPCGRNVTDPLAELRAHAFDIKHDAAILDIDTPGHHPITPAQIEDARVRLAARPDLGWWTGRGGIKAFQVYDPEDPLTPEQQELHLRQLARELEVLLGAGWNAPDPCFAWTWLFRLPRVVRQVGGQPVRLNGEIVWPTAPPSTPIILVPQVMATVSSAGPSRHVPDSDRERRARAWLAARPVHRHGDHRCNTGVRDALWGVVDGFGVDARTAVDLVRDWASSSGCPNLEADLAGARPTDAAPSLSLLNDPQYQRTPLAPIADGPGLHVQGEDEDDGAPGEAPADAADTTAGAESSGPSSRPPAVRPRVLPEIVISTKEGEINDEIIAALAANDRTMFQLDRQLVTIGRYTRGGPVAIVPLATESVQERITRACDLLSWHVTKSIQELRPAHPPSWMAMQIAARGSWRGIRYLTGIISTPTLRPDGTILQGTTPCYDESTGLLYIPDGEYPPIPENPTKEEAAASLARLKEPFVQFPFRTSRDRTSHIACEMSIPLRWSVDGCMPIGFYEASDVASGKTLLVHCNALIGTGQTAPEITYTLNDTDLRKLIFTRIAEGSATALFDNIPANMPFGGAVLEAYATSEFFADRILGKSRSKTLPTKSMMIFVTGNNVALSREIPRRLLPVYLEPTDPQRTVKPYPDILAMMRQRRREALADILCIVRAYIAAGRPAVAGCHWGSFQGWADVIARPLVWLGEEDPCLGHLDKLESDDAPATSEAQFLSAWFELYGNRQKLSADVLRDARRAKNDGDEDASDAERRLARSIAAMCRVKVAGEFPNNVVFGNKLRTMKGAIRGGRKLIDTGEKDHHATIWKVERLDAASDDQPSAQPAPDPEPEPEPEASLDNV